MSRSDDTRIGKQFGYSTGLPFEMSAKQCKGPYAWRTACGFRLDDGVQLELRRHHVAVKRAAQAGNRRVICLFLDPDDVVHITEAASRRNRRRVGTLCLDRDNLAGVDVVLLRELDHVMDGRLSVARF